MNEKGRFNKKGFKLLFRLCLVQFSPLFENNNHCLGSVFQFFLTDKRYTLISNSTFPSFFHSIFLYNNDWDQVHVMNSSSFLHVVKW